MQLPVKIEIIALIKIVFINLSLEYFTLYSVLWFNAGRY